MVKISAARISSAVALGALALVIAVFLIGRSRIINLISTQDWVSFKVPADAVPLNADIEATPEGVTICNRGPEPWKDILVQINGLYVAEVRLLNSGDCKQIAFSRFEMKSWKRIPGYRGLRVSHIEVLASVSRRGYSSRSF